MEINKYIDHTNLNKCATADDIMKLCDEAVKYKFQAVCVYPYYVKAVKDYLKDSNIEIATVVGFPNGASTTNTKVYEAIDAIEKGATEIDMVVNICALKNKDYNYIKQEIAEVRDAIAGKTLKVIIEECLLTDEEIIKMTEICNETFVNFIKTSTGFDKSGATIHTVELINKYKNEVLEIKASGGIKTISQVEDFINAGATRIGTSSAASMMVVDDSITEHECHIESEE